MAFDPDGGEVSEQTRLAVVGEVIGKLPIPTKENCEFLGWFTEYGIRVRNDSFVTSNMNVLYAHWTREEKEEEDPEPINVTFDSHDPEVN